MTDPQHTPETDLDRENQTDTTDSSLRAFSTDPTEVPEESERVAAPEGWEHNDVDGGITAVDVPWKGYTG